VGRELDATGASSPDVLRDRKRVAGGDGRDPDAVEVVGEERSDAALRLNHVMWSVRSRGESVDRPLLDLAIDTGWRGACVAEGETTAM
jgi:hypothetical protein